VADVDVDTQTALERVRAWYLVARLASIELPGRWFGRPFDNLHELTWSAATLHKLLLEFDSQVMCITTDPSGLEADRDLLTIEPFAQLVVDWQEYSNFRPRVESYTAGPFRLWAQGAQMRRAAGEARQAG